MAATATEVQVVPIGPGMKIAIVNVALDNSYVGAGETCDLSDIFDNEVYGGHPIEHDADNLYKLTYDLAADGAPATGKIMASYYDYDAGADGDAIDVAGAVDLSSCDGNWVFFGY
jgi:hypothetical protein